MSKILSVLIPSIPKRKWKLLFLTNELKKQIKIVKKLHPSLGNVEVLVDDSIPFLSGGLSIGAKRNKLVQSAKGKYLCFADDDDFIPPSYIETILRLAEMDCDIIAFNALFKCDTYWAMIDMSIHNPINEQSHPSSIIKRKAWHICPIKTELAKQYEFENVNYGEDWLWMEKVLTLVETESKTNEILYQYNHSTINSEADKIQVKNEGL